MAQNKYPGAWVPSVDGDRLEGTVEDITDGWSDQRALNGDGFYPLLTIRTGDNVSLNWHAFESVAYKRVMSLKPLPGERIVVTFLGEGKAKEGRNAPKLYSVVLPDRNPEDVARSVYDRIESKESN